MLQINWEDTIVAPVSGEGQVAVSLIRISGPDSLRISDGIFQPAQSRHTAGSGFLQKAKSHTIHFGKIISGDEVLDEVLVAIFRKPHSYTGEDVVEISCHGSPYIRRQLMSILLRSGARAATPGEFTQRAFLNGKMDLSQAEAVADLIASDCAASHRLAIMQMRGSYSEIIRDLRNQLVDFASMLELELDFSEEDVEFANRTRLSELVSKIWEITSGLEKSFEMGNVLKSGIPVVIAGKPNVGKSTLLNRLIMEDRAIVSEIPGTTRDTIEEEIILEGIKFRFIDTAGIRETQDAIEKIGVRKTWEKIHQSPVIIFLCDAQHSNGESINKELTELEENSKGNFRVIPVLNKTENTDTEILKNEYSNVPGLLFISAKEGKNTGELIRRLLQHVEEFKLSPGDVVISNARHADALRKSSEALKEVAEGLLTDKTTDLIVADLRIALYHLGSITGEIASTELLANIFSRFCIGK